MRILTAFLTILVLSTTAGAQGISVDASAEVRIPADRITFHINLNAEADTPQKAYSHHKEREKILVQLLREHNIKEKDINFEPITITETRTNSDKKRIITRQSVILSLDDFSAYEQIQITLIDNNFDEFRGNFTSSKTKKGETEALKKAIKTAREKANIIAGSTDLSITGIKDISYSYNQRSPQPMMEMRASQSSSDLLDFDQMVSVSASVSIRYTTQQN